MIVDANITVGPFAPKEAPYLRVEDPKEKREKQISQRKKEQKKRINQE
ncbi:MAG: hypothetical protein ACMUEL_05615 [Flavobacteriales bacterium Tduv]